MTEFPVTVKLQAIDNASKVLNRAGKSAGRLRSALGKVGQMATGVMGGMLAFQGITTVMENIKEGIEDASKFDEMILAFERLKKESTLSLETITDASRGTVAQIDALKAANAAMLLGIDPTAIPEMMKVARAAAVAMGEDTTFMFESIATGVGRQSKMILDNLGIVFDANQAYEEYATQIGKTTSELSDAERKQAFLNATMKAGREMMETMGEAPASAAEAFQQFQATAKNLKMTLSRELLPALTTAATFFSDLAQRIGPALSKELKGLKSAFSELATEIFGSDEAAGEFFKRWVIETLRILVNIVRGWAMIFRDLTRSINRARDAVKGFFDQIDAGLKKGVPKKFKRMFPEKIDVEVAVDIPKFEQIAPIKLEMDVEAVQEGVDEANGILQDGLVTKAQGIIEEFKNCSINKFGEMETESGHTMRDLVNAVYESINKGLIGDAQRGIQEFVDCAGDKQGTMNDVIKGHLDELWSEYTKNLNDISKAREEGDTEELARLEEQNAKITAKRNQLYLWIRTAERKHQAEMAAMVPPYFQPSTRARSTPFFRGTFGPATGLQAGGIVTKPTAAILGERRRPEGVFPLNRLKQFMPSQGPGGPPIIHMENINFNFTGPIDPETDMRAKVSEMWVGFKAKMMEEGWIQ